METIKYNHFYMCLYNKGLRLFEGGHIYIEYNHNKKHQGIRIKSICVFCKSIVYNTSQNINLES